VDKLGVIKVAEKGSGGWTRPGANQKRKKELIDIGLRMDFKGFGNFIQDGLKGHWTKNRGSIFCQSTAQKYIHSGMCTRGNPRHLKNSGFTESLVTLQRQLGFIRRAK